MKINIIGAGVSGLSAGCFLQMKGFETEIFEKHNLPGGLCTNWKVGDTHSTGASTGSWDRTTAILSTNYGRS